MDAHLSTLLELIAFDDGTYDEAKFRAVYSECGLPGQWQWF